ncbi:MAG: SpoIIIAH-like family protein [Clostridiales bacterium]|nr:SpoIIIAH-like family protein [Clostridiales bacterium]
MKKKRIHKNQVVITTLAFLIAIAGYISYDKSAAVSGSGSEVAEANADGALSDGEYDIVFTDDTESVITSVSAGSDAAESTEAEGEQESEAEEESINAGEAVLTSTVTGSTDYASQIRLNREQVRSKYMENLSEIIDNESLTDEQKQDAVTQLAEIAAIADAEAEAEALLEAKGFENVVVSITDGTCDVVLDMGEVTDAKLSQVEDIVKRKTGVEAENIIITAINTQEETVIE